MNKNIYTLVGPAANGKSTYSDKISLKANCPVVLNADSIREDLYGDASIQGDGKEVFDNLFDQYQKALKNDICDCIIIDNTSLTYRIRKRYWDLASTICPMFDHEFFYYLVFFNLPLEEALRRNAVRQRVVPEDVIRSQYERYRKPNEHEDFLNSSLLNFNIIEA